jgi:hypothetical protein
MTNKLLLCFSVCIWILLVPFITLAQDIQRTATANGGSVAAVSFAFSSSTEGASITQGEGDDNRYYVRVPIANNPIADPDPQVELRVERDKSDKEFLVYSFPIKAGTSPQVHFERASLKIRFTLPSSVSRSNSTPAAKLSTVTGVASGMNTGNSSTRAGTSTPAAAPSLQTGTVPPAVAKNESIKTAAIDLSIPESPAFTVLGLTPQTVTRPASPRELATSLLNGVDQHGNFQSGLALDLAPYLLFAGDQLGLRDYQRSRKLRLLTRFQTSFATTKGASEDDKSTRLALGFHATLWDRGDPRLDNELLGSFARELRVGPDNILEPIPMDDPGPNATPEQKAEYAEYLKEKKRYDQANEAIGVENERKAEECRKASRKKNWNKSSWIIAAAPSWISTDGKTSNFRWNGGGIWSSLAYGFEGVPGLASNSQLIFHVRYRNNEMGFLTQKLKRVSSRRIVFSWAVVCALELRIQQRHSRVYSFDRGIITNPSITRPDSPWAWKGKSLRICGSIFHSAASRAGRMDEIMALCLPRSGGVSRRRKRRCPFSNLHTIY